MRQRLTLIIRLRPGPAGQDWCGRIERVDPYRQACFGNRSELWALLDNWAGETLSAADDRDEEEMDR